MRTKRRQQYLLNVTNKLAVAAALLVGHLHVMAQVRLGSEIEQERQAKQGILFGVRLSPAGVRLLREVEQAYGKGIRQLSSPGAAAHEAGAAGVEGDGTPVISLNDSVGKREEVVVHELFHLKLFAEGYYEVQFVPAGGVNKEALDKLSGSVLYPAVVSQVDHAVFFPRMRSMGLNPVFDQRTFWEKNFRSPPGDSDPSGAKMAWALYYFRAVTQLGDPELLGRVVAFYGRTGRGEALALGRQMEAMYRKAAPLEPGSVLRLNVEICNLLFGGVVQFSVASAGPERRGGFLMPKAYITVSPKPTG